MGPPRDPRVTSRIMSAVRGRDTEPERLLRSALHRCGLRFRLEGKALPGRPDIVFRRVRVAVFVDGDFWHGGGWKARGFESFEAQFTSVRAPFWLEKIRGNVERDMRVNEQLRELGWKVVRVWESDVRKSPDQCAAKVLRVIKNRERDAR